MNNIDSHLKSCSPKNDVYTYSFNSEEVKIINEALNKKSWVDEVRMLLQEQEEKESGSCRNSG